MYYPIETWKKYEVSDNGTYAPKGSNPTFHTDLRIYKYPDTNPMHPMIHGYVMHSEMEQDYIVPMVYVAIYDIHDD